MMNMISIAFAFLVCTRCDEQCNNMGCQQSKLSARAAAHERNADFVRPIAFCQESPAEGGSNLLQVSAKKQSPLSSAALQMSDSNFTRPQHTDGPAITWQISRCLENGVASARVVFADLASHVHLAGFRESVAMVAVIFTVCLCLLCIMARQVIGGAIEGSDKASDGAASTGLGAGAEVASSGLADFAVGVFRAI